MTPEQELAEIRAILTDYGCDEDVPILECVRDLIEDLESLDNDDSVDW